MKRGICDDLYIEHLKKKKNNESFLCDKDNFVGKLEYSCNVPVYFCRPKTSCFVFVGREEFN